MCNRIENGGSCRFGDRCDFAHTREQMMSYKATGQDVPGGTDMSAGSGGQAQHQYPQYQQPTAQQQHQFMLQQEQQRQQKQGQSRQVP